MRQRISVTFATLVGMSGVNYREDSRSAYHKFPKALDKLGRCLGPSQDHGNEMCQWVLSEAEKSKLIAAKNYESIKTSYNRNYYRITGVFLSFIY